MNKNNVTSLVLFVAIGVLYVLHFSGTNGTSAVDSSTVIKDEIQEDLSVPLEETSIIELTDSTKSSAIKKAVSSKVGYFKIKKLVESSSYLNLRTKNLIEKKERLYRSFATKEQAFNKMREDKQKELADYDKKGILVQSHYEQAQREVMERQQMLQAEFEKEEKAMAAQEQKFTTERDNIIFSALQTLNETAGWDYVLVDNPEIRLVIPFNEKNDITKSLAVIINQKHK